MTFAACALFSRAFESLKVLSYIEEVTEEDVVNNHFKDMGEPEAPFSTWA